MSGGCTAVALWRSQFAGCRGRRHGHGARPFTRQPRVVERPIMRRAPTAPSMSAGITPLSVSTVSQDAAFRELRYV